MTLSSPSSSSASSVQPGSPYRVMLVDDSPTVRMVTKRWLEKESDIEVVASCRNGLEALTNLRRNRIEIVILDIEMPQMDGLQALPEIFKVAPDIKVIMSSTLTTRNADISMRCLEKGATDYIPKPTNGAELSGAQDFRRDLIEKIRGLGQGLRRQRNSVQASGARRPVAPTAPVKLYSGEITTVPASATRPQILGIGSSTGGPNALIALLSSLDPRKVPPIVIAQHMPPTFTTVLAEHITRKTKFVCKEGTDGALLVPGQVLVAPGDFHMTVTGQGGPRRVVIDKGPAENFCRPAVDPLFRSLAQVYGRAVLAVVLTGMGHDGREGAKEIVKQGGTILAQDEASSVVWGMPGAVAHAGVCHKILPLDGLSESIMSLVGNR